MLGVPSTPRHAGGPILVAAIGWCTANKNRPAQRGEEDAYSDVGEQEEELARGRQHGCDETQRKPPASA